MHKKQEKNTFSLIFFRKEGIYLLITREVDYALRILRDLSDGNLHVMKELCEREMVPHKFAYKIIRKLADAKLIQATRGVGGGVRLTADLSQITLYDLLEIIDPGRHISACTAANDQCEWRERDKRICRMHIQLSRIERVFNTELKRNSLQTLLFGDDLPENSGSTMK